MFEFMNIERRTFIVGAAATAATSCASVRRNEAPMYGLIGKMTAQPGKRDELIAILVEGVSGMPGCLSYIVAHDPNDPDKIWVTEAWTDKAAHAASLSLPSVRAAIAKGRPLIAGMESVAETIPIGGSGLRA
jgi:quinol monooxygenase YgiN